MRDGAVTVTPLPTLPQDVKDAADFVEAMAATLQSQHGPGSLVLAIPSAWCLCARVSTSSLERGGRRRALAFRMEEHLPLSAEQCVGDYVELADGEALGVCADLAMLQRLVDALERHDQRVAHIMPTVLLAAARVADDHPGCGAVLLDTADSRHSGVRQLDLVELRDGRPSDWHWFGNDVEAIEEHLATRFSGDDARTGTVLWVRSKGTSARDLAAESVRLVAVSGFSPVEAAAKEAAHVLAGDAQAWVDLRRDALAPADALDAYRGQIGLLAGALTLLLLAVIGVTQWRAHAYSALTDRTQQQLAEVFREALPEQRVPPLGMIKRRMQSEHRQLAGLGGQAPGSEDPAQLRCPSALGYLAAILSHMPDDVHVRIVDLTISPDRIRLDGQTRTHADAERISVALRDSGRFEVEPPKTQALRERGVNFVFTARPLHAEPTRSEGADQ